VTEIDWTDIREINLWKVWFLDTQG